LNSTLGYFAIVTYRRTQWKQKRKNFRQKGSDVWSNEESILIWI